MGKDITYSSSKKSIKMAFQFLTSMLQTQGHPTLLEETLLQLKTFIHSPALKWETLIPDSQQCIDHPDKNYIEKYGAKRHYQPNSNRYLQNSPPKQKTI